MVGTGGTASLITHRPPELSSGEDEDVGKWISEMFARAHDVAGLAPYLPCPASSSPRDVLAVATKAASMVFSSSSGACNEKSNTGNTSSSSSGNNEAPVPDELAEIVELPTLGDDQEQLVSTQF